MKKLKKFFKIIFLSGVIFFVAAVIFSVSYYHIVTSSVALDTEKLSGLSASTLEILDTSGQNMSTGEISSIDISKLNKHTINAFISTEDKRFYYHHGIDYLRLGGAMLNNLKTRSFSQGGSTISQQLIKNTHLSSEKTISRKLKEFKLTRQLEKTYSKNDILKMYLENIYFGNGCYGLENASIHYFGKSATELNLSESALLAGTINAPSYYDIENKPKNATARRNLVLSLMKNQGKISDEEFEAASAEPINLHLTKLKSNAYACSQIIEEACEILEIHENEIRGSNIKIYTYYDASLGNKISEKIERYSTEGVNASCLVLDNRTGGIVAAVGSAGLSSLHQPGSAIKPILVYAPAIEKKIISPATKILDSKVDYSGYSPENADGVFHGFVSVRDAVKHSYNIPAVKILKEVGIENAQNVAKKFGIEFDAADNNLSIALGGFTDGITLKSLGDAYMALACGGNYKVSNYISKITKNGRIIYKDKKESSKVMGADTAYLITDMLKDTANSGTARRLKNMGYDIASKTGTVGLEGYNTNAFNAAFTSRHTIITYFGGDKMPETINGSTYPTMLTKDTLETLYASFSPENFKKPSSVTEVPLSKNSYENNIVVQANSSESSFKELFSKYNLPPTYLDSEEN